jgi:hypothetical protein
MVNFENAFHWSYFYQELYVFGQRDIIDILDGLKNSSVEVD